MFHATRRLRTSATGAGAVVAGVVVTTVAATAAATYAVGVHVGAQITEVADSAVGDYSVANVVTAGSSIGNFDIPSQVDVLSFERTGDLVPATDGAVNPATTNPATTNPATTNPATTNPATTNPVTVSADPPGMGDGTEPHNAYKYAETAGGFQASGDPNAEYFTDSSQQFFSGGTAIVSDYQATG